MMQNLARTMKICNSALRSTPRGSSDRAIFAGSGNQQLVHTKAMRLCHMRVGMPCVHKHQKSVELARGISGEEKRHLKYSIFDEIKVDDDYEGPKLEDSGVTESFARDLMKTFKAQGRLHEKYACKILLQVGELFSKVPSLVDITLGKDETFTICGDIHGQFYDLMNIFEINGSPSPSKGYLFNGDFVDRGAFSVECALTLFTYKLLHPDNFHLARGNHESSAMNALYGFEKEVNAKYSSWMARLFAMVFNQLPLAHCFNGKVLVPHGGLFSEEGVTLNDIRSIERNREPPEEGLMSDILWSDPQEEMGRSPSGRGAGVRFGPDVTEKFLASNELKYIIRSHEAKSEGYEIGQGGKCLTVFSAPNYRDVMGNKGAFIRLRGKDLMAEFVTFEAVRHPEPINYSI